ncbi:hypothetical protein CIRG_10304 [Coccidioides immitis RMSCC 2394]|uniref:Uncharacterized protein n=1 Tax=Coccidioides immitis RMSCC 2394 TaxID=404692 RepID=A0A0J6Y1G0_COCIT|nr:hypothetical protein CIRG_10304 [Coccidioides immitis RMSCC 2394]
MPSHPTNLIVMKSVSKQGVSLKMMSGLELFTAELLLEVAGCLDNLHHHELAMTSPQLDRFLLHLHEDNN